MKTKELKKQAKELLNNNNNRKVFMFIILIISLIQLIPYILNDIEANIIVRIITLIIVFPIFHGIIYSSLRIIDNEKITNKDSLYGLKKYKNIITTYLLTTIFVILILLITIYPLFVIIGINLNNYILEPMESIFTAGNIVLLLVGIIIAIVITFITVALISLVYYLLEEHSLKNIKAIKMSCSIMKSQILNYAKLMISFIGWILLSFMLDVFLTMYINSTFTTIIVKVFEIITFLPNLYICQALFYRQVTNKYLENK